MSALDEVGVVMDEVGVVWLGSKSEAPPPVPTLLALTVENGWDCIRERERGERESPHTEQRLRLTSS